MADARVAEVRRHPVKSMRGECLAHGDFTARGLDGDRHWGVTFDDGKVGSGKNWRHLRRIEGLLEYAAGTVDGAVVVRTPDGRTHAAGDPGLDEELSRLAAAPVRLAEEREVQHFDCAAVHLLSRPALSRLAALMPQEADQIVVERFRPNLLLDGDDLALLEDDWVGAKVAVGPEVVLEITERTERCVMTTLPQPGLPAARTVLRTLAQRFDTRIGVYARVIRGGRVGVGDLVQVT
ncbi:MOSC domain-containing protein [Streptomyces cinnabarinus]|uniref:MOSC domain-containing protein n=1 Tax=Streptomyces cinnabarinus TaxID=67287 RepID=A0ABY7KGG7_9ACTN|nr:MOSC domain-containing protein [Streptomyces cinnabarinus]WAZ21821.1 MOSC domain-containing protein [Streptomyces cinnabarinus]